MSFKPRPPARLAASPAPAASPASAELRDVRRQVDRAIRALTRPPPPGLSRHIERCTAARELAALGPVAGRAVRPLLRALEAADPLNLPHFANAVAAIGGAAVVVALLERRDISARRVGCLEQAVIAIGAPAVPALVAALGHQAWYVRQGAALALAGLRPAIAVEPLLDALGDVELAVRSAAAVALGQIGDPRAVAPLLELHRQTALTKRQQIAVALDGCGYLPSSPTDPVHIDQLLAHDEWQAVSALGAAAVSYLLEVERDCDDYHRSSILATLGRIGDRRAVPQLLAALGNRQIRYWAVEALGQIGDRQAAAPVLGVLVAELSGEPEPVAAAAAEALGRLGDRNAVEPLCLALEEHYPIRLRCQAVRALGRIGETRVADKLAPLLGDPHAELRLAAAEALDRLIPAADLDARLERLIASRDWPGLIAVGRIAVAPILAGLRRRPEEVQPELIRVLGRIGHPSAAAPVIDWLFDHPVLIADAEALASWTDSLYPLFDYYPRIILQVASAVRRKKLEEGTQYRDDYRWIYDHGWINQGLRELATIDGQIAINLLHRVAVKPDVVVETGYVDQEIWPHPTSGPLSFARQRGRARRELTRRGDPPADPAAFATSEGFRSFARI